DLYQSITRNLLYNVSIPEITGFPSISTNIGRLKNKGIEVSITSENIKSKKLSWTTTINFSSNSNTIETLLGLDRDGDGKEDDLVSSGLCIGRSIGAIYGYEQGGIYQVNDDIPAGFYPSTFKIVDRNGNGKITPDDRVIKGRTEPAYRFSIHSNLSYKQFTLSFLINSIQGGRNGYLGANSVGIIRNDNNIRWNHYKDIDYWTPTNPKGRHYN